MDAAIGFLSLAALAYGAYVIFRALSGWYRRTFGGDPPAGTDPVAGSAPTAAVRDELRDAGANLHEELGGYPVREDLEGSATLAKAVRRLDDRRVPIDELVVLARDGDPWVSRIALHALAGRSDIPADWSSYAVRRLRGAPYDQAWLFLRTLEQVREPVVGPALSQVDHVLHRDLAELVAARLTDGREEVDEETFRQHVPISLADSIGGLLDEWDALIPELREAFEAWRATTLDAELLAQFARIWSRPYDEPPALLVGSRVEVVERIYETVSGPSVASVLLVGEHGVGKTALARAALERLPSDWLVFEASAASVNAGAVYVGELEGRVRQIIERLRGRPAVWVLPDLEEALWTGRHSQSPLGLLDHLLPHVQGGDLRLVSEVTPASYEVIVAQRPQVAAAFDALRIRPLDEQASIAVAAHALEQGDLDAQVSAEVLAESFELAQQFVPGSSPPGNVVRLVESAAERVLERGERRVETSDVLATIARTTGLPLALLDPEAELDLGRVRAFFEERVLGQPEAVECLVERIAMIKAGLTDPTRPFGVFLFVGPTGTGKTEIAKTLAEFLFGSQARLVRLDMSEYQTPDSLERLLSDTSIEPQGAPLVSAVRRDPFSVVLLDEFEKAAAPIWDLFLQVFDDGRLTDRHGRVLSLRRCVIVLTSNIGSSIARGPGLGFDRQPDAFSSDAIRRAVDGVFRPEFLNRLDRIVVFRPFEREQMRALLEKELADAAELRGLRGRPWAIEYDDAALEFLIDRGFSPEFGARPLKRAVERHLLAPLARAIVDRTVPEGDQFLFVTAARGGLEVRFVDPDADDRAEPSAERGLVGDLDVRSLMLAPRTDPAIIAFLLGELQELETVIEGETVLGRKEAGLDAIARPGFWDDGSRFAVLAEVEYLDRLKAAHETARRLGERLRSQGERNGHGSSELVDLLATRLYVLRAALVDLEGAIPGDLLLRIRPVAGELARSVELVETLAEMYEQWAERRRMKVSRMESESEGVVLSVSGLGAVTILSPERGLHVLEVSGKETGAGDRTVDRVVAAVEFAGRAGEDGHSVGASAEEAFRGRATPTDIVRRYRAGSSPLVRDAVRGYRTGRLDRVLAGDFDLFA